MLNVMLNLLRTRSDFFLGLLLEHLQISAVSILLAMVIGLGIGIAISEYPQTSKPVMAAVNFVYTIPSISLLGFLIPISGIGDATAIIALTVYALLPMVRNTHTGLTVTHDINEALKLGTKVLVIDHGAVLQYASPGDVRAYPADEFVKTLLSRAVW